MIRATHSERHAPPRELLLAMPAALGLYEAHQLVWRFAAAAAPPGVRPLFLYRIDGDNRGAVARVRSVDFTGGSCRAVTPDPRRPFRIDLAAVSRSDRGQRAIEADRLNAWCTHQMETAGFDVDDLCVESSTIQAGAKHDRNSGRNLTIVVPTARVHARLRIRDADRAHHAWCFGIGRARRFGLGMLTQ